MQLNKSNPENDFDALLKKNLQLRQEPQRPEFTSKILQQIKLQETRNLLAQIRRQLIFESLLYLAAAIVLLALAAQYHNTMNQSAHQLSGWIVTAATYLSTHNTTTWIFWTAVALIFLVYANIEDLWEQDYH